MEGWSQVMDSPVVCCHAKKEKKTQTPSKSGETSTQLRLKDVDAALEIFVIDLFHINFTLRKLL
jgi:hypothetical protein